MRNSNHSVVPSQHLRLLLPLFFGICLCSSQTAQAELLFSEDFSSGNQSLVHWTSLGSNSRSAVTGDLVLSGTDWGIQILTGVPEVQNLSQMSVRRASCLRR